MQNIEIKKKLLAKVLQFAYEPGYEDLNILSKQYFASVVFSRYLGNPSQVDTVIFADFDKLNQINQEIGFDQGSQVMYESMKVVASVLSSANAKIARVAGDEFAYILQGFNQEEANLYIEKINKALDEHKKEILGKHFPKIPQLSITSVAVDSNHSDGLYDAYKKAEETVNEIKSKSKQELIDLSLPESEFIDKVIVKCYHSMRNFFDCLRCSSNQHLPIENIDTLFPKFVDSSLKSCSVLESPSITEEKIPNKNKKLEILPPYEAMIIHDLITSSSIDKDGNRIFSSSINWNTIGDISSDTLFYLIDYLMKNPNTHEISRKPFETYIMPYLKYPINAKLISTSFLKVSNAKQGHLNTDQDINLLADLLHQSLDAIYNFNESPYLDSAIIDSSTNDFLISLDSTDFLLLHSGEKKLSNDQLNQLLKKINTQSSILKLTSIPFEKVSSSEELINYIENGKSTASQQKDLLKMQFLDTDKAIGLFGIYFRDVINEYHSFFGLDALNDKNADLFKQIVIMSAQRVCIERQLLSKSNLSTIQSLKNQPTCIFDDSNER